MRRARVLTLLAAIAILTAARPASATEQEWHLGATLGYGSLHFARAIPRNGLGGQLLARYGLTDAFDLTMDAGVDGYFEDGRFLLSTAVGGDYVLDVSRWIPTVGVNLGLVDFVTPSCDSYPDTCGHTLLPAVGLPVSLEYRALPNLPVGVRFQYRFIFLGDPTSQIFVGLYAAMNP